MQFPKESTDIAHMYYIETQNREIRDELQNYLSSLDIQATTHYQPLHASKAGKTYASSKLGIETNSEDFASRVLRLPVWLGLSVEIQIGIIKSIGDFERQNAI
jgi:dTDP-4-amino-4,6-dideoxygalactose transaminase